MLDAFVLRRRVPPVYRVVVMAFLLGVLLALSPSETAAQRQVGAFGVGARVGLPGGAALKLYRPDDVAYDVAFTTDFRKRGLLYVHRVWERPVPDSPLWYFIGPGLLGGVQTPDRTAEAVAGVSVTGGLNFYAERFEVFLQATPRLRVLPSLDPRIGASVGLRYYF
jgi:hypothetical protein